MVSLGAGMIGSRFMPGDWYASLAKPPWTPPSAVFAPVWTTLYVLMGVAAWLVWQRAGFGGAGAGLIWFLVQLVLNALWSYLFFGLHHIDLALIDIVALWAAILVVTLLFWRTDWRAGALMLPYLTWVAFASALNFALWRMN
jgi:tryptophan-rich sensory protein